jgi:hypothetical protein
MPYTPAHPNTDTTFPATRLVTEHPEITKASTTSRKTEAMVMGGAFTTHLCLIFKIDVWAELVDAWKSLGDRVGKQLAIIHPAPVPPGYVMAPRTIRTIKYQEVWLPSYRQCRALRPFLQETLLLCCKSTLRPVSYPSL